MNLTKNAKVILGLCFAAWALAWGAVFLVFVLPKLMDWVWHRLFEPR